MLLLIATKKDVGFNLLDSASVADAMRKPSMCVNGTSKECAITPQDSII